MLRMPPLDQPDDHPIVTAACRNGWQVTRKNGRYVFTYLYGTGSKAAFSVDNPDNLTVFTLGCLAQPFSHPDVQKAFAKLQQAVSD